MTEPGADPRAWVRDAAQAMRWLAGARVVAPTLGYLVSTTLTFCLNLAEPEAVTASVMSVLQAVLILLSVVGVGLLLVGTIRLGRALTACGEVPVPAVAPIAAPLLGAWSILYLLTIPLRYLVGSGAVLSLVRVLLLAIPPLFVLGLAAAVLVRVAAGGLVWSGRALMVLYAGSAASGLFTVAASLLLGTGALSWVYTLQSAVGVALELALVVWLVAAGWQLDLVAAAGGPTPPAGRPTPPSGHPNPG